MGIYNSLPVVARALSDQLGVNVTVGGSTACASQQGSSFTINIPFYKDAEKLSDVLLGYLVHEAAHVKYTEFPILKEGIPARAKQGYNPSVLRKLVNITEDLRIERAIGRRFPGVPSFLKALNHFVFNEDTKPTDDPTVAFINGLLLCGFKRYHALNIPVDQAQSDFIRLFGQNMFDTAMDILGLAIKRHATREASVLRGIQAASGLRQSMHGLLQGMQQTRRTHKETGRVMDTRRLTSALLGETKLFRHKSKAVEFNSAFTVLLDSSSSLGSDMVEAEAAVVSLLFALDGIKGVSTSAYHFPHATANNVGLLKAREQSFRAAVNAKQFGISANGCTPLEQALWPAFSDLLNARADRHVMVVVTDGKPDNSGPVIQMVNDAKKEGVIVIGIGFGGANSNIMTSLFDDTGVAVGSVSALRGKLLEVSRKALTR